ncbi:MAG: ferric reductase-like transmembrane domain-containing protein [Bifidobacteriaceae bacterium]|nr:ferric reductase-like transmembrane domain-containing protein [Bifidobacteriaceae bacterium]
MAGLVAVTVAVWSMTRPSVDISTALEVAQLFGALSLVGLAAVNFITTRHGSVDAIFGGLDKSYAVHKRLSVASLALVVVHVVIAVENEPAVEAGGGHGASAAGVFSLVAFALLTLVALLARKLNYERWKAVHKWMVLPYVIGLIHYYGASDYAVLAWTPLSLWLNVVNLIGVASCFYSVFLYERLGFPWRGRVEHVQEVAAGTVEFRVRMNGFTARPGQFVFLKVNPKTRRFPSHPFTVSGLSERGLVQFTVKSLGDHTARLVRGLTVGDAVWLSRAHGRFDYSKGRPRQVWIAGGIGIAPFRSFYEAGVPQVFDIDLFYAYNSEAESPYLREVKALDEESNIRVHLCDFTETGFLTARRIRQHLHPEEQFDVYFCGPKAMLGSLLPQLADIELKPASVHYEEFQFK